MPSRWFLTLRLTILAGIVALMLVPTGMCFCADCAEESATQPHEPGCPKIRNLERPAVPTHYTADGMAVATVDLSDHDRPVGPPRVVDAVGHGPPRGRPLYLTLQTLLI